MLATAVAGAAARGHDRRPRLLHLARGETQAPAELHVGTEPGKANVVAAFDILGTWLSGDDLASIVPPTQPDTDFYLRAKGGGLQLSRAAVEPGSLPFLVTSLAGDLAKELREQGQVNLQPDKERRLSIAYDCHSPGTAALTLTLEFEGLSPVQIPFKKTCGGEKNTAITVTIGSAREGEQVVIMGTPKWDELKVVGVRPTSSIFTVFVDPLSEKGEQAISEPKATGIGSCSAVAAPPKGWGGKKIIAAGESLDVDVEYRCFRHGNCIVTAEVPFFPDMAPYQPLRWSWTKICGGEALGIDVEVADSKKRRLVATDGAANTSYSTPWIADKDVDEHTVRLVNDKSRSLESDIKVRGLTVRCLDSKRCTSRFAESMPKLLSAGSPLDLHVEYECHQSGSSIVQLILSTDGHDPVMATWAKDCSAFGDSLVGVILVMVLTCTCAACACVGFFRMFFEGADAAGGKVPLMEGEFFEEENLSAEEHAALDHYEEFYGLQKGAISLAQVKDSVLGVSGWAAKGPLGVDTMASHASA